MPLITSVHFIHSTLGISRTPTTPNVIHSPYRPSRRPRYLSQEPSPSWSPPAGTPPCCPDQNLGPHHGHRAAQAHRTATASRSFGSAYRAKDLEGDDHARERCACKRRIEINRGNYYYFIIIIIILTGLFLSFLHSCHCHKDHHQLHRHCRRSCPCWYAYNWRTWTLLNVVFLRILQSRV